MHDELELEHAPVAHPIESKTPICESARLGPLAVTRRMGLSVASGLGNVDPSWHPRGVLRLAGLAALFAFVLATPSARADGGAPPPSRGPELGVRIGVEHPGGSVGAGSQATTPKVGDVAPTWLPIGLDAGYRFWRGAYVGASLELGPTIGQRGGPCVSCDVGYVFQGRPEIRLYALPSGTWDPWLSLGFGWEVLHVTQGRGSATSGATYDGPILGNVQVGLDVHSRAVAVSPYFGVSLAEFVTHALDPAPAGETSSIQGRAVHEWFAFGVRGSYGPW